MGEGGPMPSGFSSREWREGRERGGLNEDGTLFRRSVTNLSLGHAVRYRD